ncbi:MAG TPA: CocE/NonD family hydrolase [Solirubrobacteraceae bacterium]|nr:CocE/NonD family hydrolase [Solirubrobacteraceae bacterium]
MSALTRCALIVLTVLLVALPATASAGTFNYVTNAENLTQPQYETEQLELELPAHDGKKLYIEVTKPTGPGRFPVILEASPYHGTLADREGTRILPDQRDGKGNSIGLTGYFAPRGYAVVMMDLRGTGRSEGCLDHLGPNDASDLEQVVEWAAAQSWSNGRVGMTGHSYVGSTPSVAAAQNPEGLATIVPSAGLASMYHHQFQAGVPFFLQWAGPQWAYEYLTVARSLPPVGKEPVQGSNTGDNFGNDPQEVGCGLPNSALTTGEDQFSGRYAEWHRQRDWNAEARKAKIPVFAVHGVNDNAARVSALDWFLDRRNKQDKLWLGQWDHGSGCCPTRRGMQWTTALHAWFDKHLAGRRVSTGPDIELFLADEQSFRKVREGARTEVLSASDWPVANTTMRFFPSSDGTLGRSTPQEGSRSFTGTPQGASEILFVDPTWKTGTSFRTEPFRRDVVMAGVPRLELHASVTAPRVHLIANLLDEDADGKRRRISQFAINPELRDGIATRKNVTPGQRYVLEPPGFVMAHHLRKGHRLVLQVTTADPDKAPLFAKDPQVRVFTGRDATQVTVPVARGARITPDDVFDDAITSPPHAPVKQTVTTKASGVGVRNGLTTEYVPFELLAGEDNAKMEGKATPSLPADLDLYLERQSESGSWVKVADGRNDGSLTEEVISTQRLEPGKYRLAVHNWAGPPANEVDVELTFFDRSGNPG